MGTMIQYRPDFPLDLDQTEGTAVHLHLQAGTRHHLIHGADVDAPQAVFLVHVYRGCGILTLLRSLRPGVRPDARLSHGGTAPDAEFPYCARNPVGRKIRVGEADAPDGGRWKKRVPLRVEYLTLAFPWDRAYITVSPGDRMDMPCAQPIQQRNRYMYLGCFQSNRPLHQMEYEKFAQAASDFGYVTVDVPILNDAAVATAKGLGLRLYASGAVVPPDLSRDEGQQEMLTEFMLRAIDWGHTHGVRVLTHLVGKDTSLSGDDNIAVFRELYTPIAAHAEACGVQLAFENWPRNGTMLATTPEMWDAMFNAVPSPALGLCYDPSHFYWQGIDYIQPIRDFRDRIYHAHAKDTEILMEGRNAFGIYGRQLGHTVPAQWWRYRLPGYGAVNWHQYLDELYQAGYNEALSVEHEDPVWATDEAGALRGLQLSRQFLEPFVV